MTINLSALAPITTAATALSNLIMVSPQSVVGYQPQNPPNANGTPTIAQNPPSFLFHYEGEQSVALESDITDHFIEDNTAINDQIALKPEMVSTHGFIGELNNIPPPGLALLKKTAEKLTTIAAYAPKVSETAQLAYAEAFFLYQTAANAAQAAIAAWSSIGNAATGDNGQAVVDSEGISVAVNQNKQQVAFQLFYGYWRNRTLFTVQTPWAVFQNMAIRSMRAIQEAETRVITDFDVTFKIIRTAATIAAPGSSANAQLSANAATQAAALTDLGTSAGIAGPSLTESISSFLGL